MPRPKVPLISRRGALEAALDIIDSEGIDALSIRRLADRLNVNGASLYHHFENKEEIVVGAAELALADVRTPETRDEPWKMWMLRNARNLRDAFRRHPDLVPVMLRRQPLGIGMAQLDQTATLLEDEGAPVEAVVPLLEALELFVIGSALHDARGGAAIASPDFDAEEYPGLSRAARLRGLSSDEIFEIVCTSILDTVESAVLAKRADASV